MKMLTVNEMILKTLTTKITKTPKYKEVLETMEYTLNNTHDWSCYDYWGIEIPGTDLILNISKDYRGKKRLFATAHPVSYCEDFKKFDFVNFLKVRGQREEYFMFEAKQRLKNSIPETFRNYKREMEYYKFALDRTKNKIDSAQSALKMALKEQAELVKYKEKTQKEFEEYKKSFRK